MKAPPPIVVALRPSRMGATFIVATHAATAALLAVPAMREPICAALLIPVVASAVFAWIRTRGRSAPCHLRVGLDRRIAVATGDGLMREGIVLEHTFVGAALTSIVWRPDGHRFARTALLLPDMMTGDEFRRVRVVLRYGRAGPDREGARRLAMARAESPGGVTPAIPP